MIYNFLFHRVNPKRDALWDPMDVHLFDRCIKYISKNFDVRLAEDIYVNGSKNTSRKKVATIMFDDGYKDNFDFAAPILKKYGCKASFYIVTNCIELNIPTWTHVLEYYFSNTKQARFNFNFDFIPEELNIQGLKSKEERIAYVKKLKPMLKNIPSHQREILLEDLQSTCKDIKLPELMMSWEDLKTLRKEGHYIGSHTVSHSPLGTIKDLSRLTEEIKQSGEIIKSKLGYFPLSISYPVGSYNDDTKKISKACGYKFGLAVKQNIHDPNKEDIFEISRIELYNESWFKTKLRINHSLEKIKQLIRYK